MRLRTKLIFAFLASPTFLFVMSLRASHELRAVGRDVDDLERYTQTEDLRNQVIIELLSVPEPQALVTDRARSADLEHGERALVLCRCLAARTKEPETSRAVERTIAAVAEYLEAMRAFDASVVEHGQRAPYLPEARRARVAWDGLLRVLGRGATAAGAARAPDALEAVAQEARRAVFQLARRTDENAIRLVLVGFLLAALLTLAASFGLARLTAQPIVRLVTAARAVSRGNLDVVVPVRSGDELGELSRAFNDMTRQLREIHAGLEDEIRERTEALRRREADLARERKLAAVGRLAAGVAHEVSNPLAVIAASAEGLRDRARDEPELAKHPGFGDFPAYLEQIENEAYRLKKLVRRLLDFSRGGGEPGTGRHDPYDAAAVAREAVALASLDPRAKPRPIDAAGLEGMALPVVGDPDQLKEALLNLLFNALDATAANKGRVRVAARTESGLARIDVADEGEGIPRENLERLFEPFFTTKPPGQGTGLGLALAYRACERHGGQLVAASEGRGKGATFTIEVPLAPERGS